MYNCYQCNSVRVEEEYQRCPACQKKHEELAAKLDARPKTHVPKVKEKLYPIREVKQGIQVTTWLSREDLIANGMKVPDEE